MTNKIKRQPTEWEKIIASHISDKKLISKIYKEITHSQITINNQSNLKNIEDLSGHFSKVDIHRPIATDQHCWPPEIPLLAIYKNKMKTWIWKEICTPMFIAALFTIAKIWKQTKYTLLCEWRNDGIYINTFNGLLQGHKKNEILPFAKHGWALRALC